MKKVFFLLALLPLLAISALAQIKIETTTRNSENTRVLVVPSDVSNRIFAKAKELNLGAIHSESPTIRPTAGKGGYFLRYEKGWVYYNPKTKAAYGIWGDIMNKWAAQRFEIGWLGFPVTSHTNTPNRTGAYAHFDNGSIYWSPGTGAHFVGGAFRDYWKTKGWENSAALGFPKTDEVEIFVNGYTRYQQFEKGTLFWGVNKDILYSSDPNATTPPVERKMELTFTPNMLKGHETGDDPNISLYGWMDVRIYGKNGKEISDDDGKSFSIFSIEKKQPVIAGVFAADFVKPDMQRHYTISQADIDGNGFIRITCWLNDYDEFGPNDYLKLRNSNGGWNYNGGNHPYREIKLKEIVRRGNSLKTDDTFEDHGDYVELEYTWSIK